MNIWFDMDGTLVDLYGIPNWLEYLQSDNPAPYLYAKPLLKLAPLARILNKLIRKGHTINIISWTAKNGSTQYNAEVAAAKIKWLKQHLWGRRDSSYRFCALGSAAWYEVLRLSA